MKGHGNWEGTRELGGDTGTGKGHGNWEGTRELGRDAGAGK